jgi:alginate O-acetyltransferase complex protein AlgI
MLFNSLEFVIFFPVVVALYFSIPHRYRWALLLAASYYFYMCWKAEYIFLIVASTLIDYYAGIQMGKTAEKRNRTKYLIMSLLANIGLLFSFKYFNFFNDSMRSLFDSLNIFYGVPALKVLLPVGISFYTFQTLSYTIDVYRGTREPEKHLGIFAVYVSFFPQLVAGPIERSTSLMPQFYKKNDFSYQRAVDGLKLMLWGFFKKIVIADRLAFYVNHVYNNPGDYSGAPLIMATYFFAFQIYCDFSGYSDIAIGAARVMGYDLMDNFKRPYFSKSISEFWKRWHISLSSWFRDYLYISLGGSRVAKWRWYYNLFIVFVVSGFWHGANWTFMVWGALHGAYLVISIWTGNLRRKVCDLFNLTGHPKIHRAVKVFVTFHLVLLAWVFFRANSLGDAFFVLRRMLSVDFGNLLPDLAAGFNPESVTRGTFDLMVAVAVILFMEVVHLTQRSRGTRDFISDKPVWLQWSYHYAVIIGIILFGVFQHAEFIYFQF